MSLREIAEFASQQNTGPNRISVNIGPVNITPHISSGGKRLQYLFGSNLAPSRMYTYFQLATQRLLEHIYSIVSLNRSDKYKTVMFNLLTNIH